MSEALVPQRQIDDLTRQCIGANARLVLTLVPPFESKLIRVLGPTHFSSECDKDVVVGVS